MNSLVPIKQSNCLAQIETLQKQNVSMYVDPANPIEVVPLGFFQSIWHYRDETFYTEQEHTIAAIISNELTTLRGKSPSETGEDKIVRIASDFFRKHKESSDSVLVAYRKELAAIKLGLTPEILEQNPGFEQFAINHHLDRYLWRFGHTLTVGQQGICVRVKGVEKQWQEIVNDPLGNYGQNGFQAESSSAWKKLKPMIQGKLNDRHEWGDRYIFELCSWYSKEAGPRIAGDHTWMRLKTPVGNVYSVGVYMPKKHNPGFKEKIQPMSVFKSGLYSPDKSEFWPGQTYDTLSFEMTERQFMMMKSQIEQDQADGLPFQLLNGNCTQYAGKIAKIADIYLPTESPWPNYLFPDFVTAPFGFIHSVLPRFLQVIAEVITAMVLNTFALLLGGWRVDSEVIDADNQDPFISSFWDFFDITKINIHHPYVLATTIRETVLEWRRAEIEAHPKSREEIIYALPPQYRWTNPRKVEPV